MGGGGGSLPELHTLALLHPSIRRSHRLSIRKTIVSRHSGGSGMLIRVHWRERTRASEAADAQYNPACCPAGLIVEPSTHEKLLAHVLQPIYSPWPSNPVAVEARAMSVACQTLLTEQSHRLKPTPHATRDRIQQFGGTQSLAICQRSWSQTSIVQGLSSEPSLREPMRLI